MTEGRTSDLQITPIPAFSDNYIWLLRQPGQRQAAVVDPGEAEPVRAALDQAGIALSAILITHHHPDHTGGVAELIGAFPDAAVIAPHDRRIRGVTQAVAEADQITLPGLGLSFEVLEIPGHTATHIAYLGDGALFCGDTLFMAGCGRVFDGSAEQLGASLLRIAALPPETLCYCAHEYTLVNLGFAAWVEPDNERRQARLAEAERLRAAGRPTVPAPLALELATNPFLRTREPAVIAAAEGFAGHRLRDEIEVFAALRRWKDTEYD